VDSDFEEIPVKRGKRKGSVWRRKCDLRRNVTVRIRYVVGKSGLGYIQSDDDVQQRHNGLFQLGDPDFVQEDADDTVVDPSTLVEEIPNGENMLLPCTLNVKAARAANQALQTNLVQLEDVVLADCLRARCTALDEEYNLVDDYVNNGNENANFTWRCFGNQQAESLADLIIDALPTKTPDIGCLIEERALQHRRTARDLGLTSSVREPIDYWQTVPYIVLIARTDEYNHSISARRRFNSQFPFRHLDAARVAEFGMDFKE